MSKVRDLNQVRMQLAFKAAEEGNKVDKFGSYVKKLPAMIVQNGLANTVAFMHSKMKDGNAWEVVYDELGKYLREMKKIESADLLDNLKSISDKDSRKLRALTIETLDWIGILKRFVTDKPADKPTDKAQGNG